MKVVINKSFGGFGLSHKGVMRYAEIAGFKLYPYLDQIARDVYKERAVIGNEEITHHYSRVPVEGLPANKDGFGWPELPEGAYWYDGDLERNDPALIQVVEEMGKAANGNYSKLAVVEIPDGTEYVIEEYDGQEHIAEAHQTWA